MKKKHVFLILLSVAAVLIVCLLVVLLTKTPSTVTDQPTAQATKQRLSASSVDVGMTTTEVTKALGYPDDQDTLKTDGTYFKTFTYIDDFNRCVVVQFENGKVTSVGEY